MSFTRSPHGDCRSLIKLRLKCRLGSLKSFGTIAFVSVSYILFTSLRATIIARRNERVFISFERRECGYLRYVRGKLFKDVMTCKRRKQSIPFDSRSVCSDRNERSGSRLHRRMKIFVRLSNEFAPLQAPDQTVLPVNDRVSLVINDSA